MVVPIKEVSNPIVDLEFLARHIIRNTLLRRCRNNVAEFVLSLLIVSITAVDSTRDSSNLLSRKTQRRSRDPHIDLKVPLHSREATGGGVRERGRDFSFEREHEVDAYRVRQ